MIRLPAYQRSSERERTRFLGSRVRSVLILNETHESAIWINQGTDASVPCLGFRRVQARLSSASRLGVFADCIKGVEVVQPGKWNLNRLPGTNPASPLL